MIIVSGKLYLRPGSLKSFLAASGQAVAQARSAPGCRDFVVAADTLEPERVNVYEEWESEQDLLKFRGEGPDDDLWSSVVSASVFRHEVSSSGPA